MSYLNEADARRQIESIGIIIKDGLHIRTDGKSTRCLVSGMDREKRGWYRLSEWPMREGVMLVGTYGIFQGDSYGTRKIELTKQCEACGHEMALKDKTCPACGKGKGKKRELTAEEKAAMAAKFKEDKRRADAERQAEIKRAATWAGAVWRASVSAEVGGHDYFARKRLEVTGGARIYPGNDGVDLPGATPEDYKYLGQFKGALVIPMCDTLGKVYGVQFILSRELHKERIARTERDKEFWPAGMGLEGRFFLMGGSPRGVALVTEGYATGVSLLQASNRPVLVAFAANNIQPAIKAVAKQYKGTRWLIAADDDWLQKCVECKQYTPVETDTCAHCGQPHKKINAGCTRAAEAALAVPNTAWVKPTFSAQRPADRKGPTDYNDLHGLEGLGAVTAQIDAAIAKQGWDSAAPTPDARGAYSMGGGESGEAMPSLLTEDDACQRYALVYAGGGVMFDHVDRVLVTKSDVLDMCVDRVWSTWKYRPDRQVVRMAEVGFDPTEKDPAIRCNMWGGWPTVPKSGRCDKLLGLLEFLCANEQHDRALYEWVLKWLAYPIQHPGAKMHSAIVVHGPQGTGKSLFFERYMRIFGPYATVLDQSALEDKFNADWAQKKLFILADEVLARQDMYHVKNRLKGFITGSKIRVNPKNVTAHDEANHMNMVFLSNEKMPIVLEDDDRRHCVIWVPPKLDKKYYDAVEEECEQGGVEALHHYLLGLDLGDFKPWTRPPMTEAKQDLINLGLGSEDRFIKDWEAGDTPHPFGPCASMDLYKAYLKWCRENGVQRPRESSQFLNSAAKIPGWKNDRPHIYDTTHYTGQTRQQRMILPATSTLELAGKAQPLDKTKSRWLTDCFFTFRNSLEDSV